MARVRDYAAEYARRQARAREAGFRSYYAKRVAGTAPGSEARARKSGHRAASDLEQRIRSGRVVAMKASIYGRSVTVRTVDDRGRSQEFNVDRDSPVWDRLAQDARDEGVAMEVSVSP